MQALANSLAFWLFAFLAIIVVYLLPTLIGMIRRVDRLALVFLVNLIGAPTGVGWLAAMIPEEMEKIRELLGPAYGAGKYDDAAKIFADLVNNDTFVEFLTLPAYERID